MTINTFAVIILAALIIDYALKLIGNVLNLRALKLELPPVLQAIYKPEEYRKSQEYLRVNTRFGLLESTFNLLVLLIFWIAGGFNWFYGVITGWNMPNVLAGLLYIGILMLAYTVLQLPFNIYSTFVIEERFGFNKTTLRTFIIDLVKGFLLALILGGLILVGTLALFQYAGRFAWLYCWAVVIVFSLAMQYVAPTWIMPLFNKYTPMAEGELREAILKYAGSVNFPVKNIYVMDGSKRSTKSNAFFTGFGNNKRIALFDTLIAQHTIPEMVAVLAHEVGHYKKKHILQGMVISVLHMAVLFYLLSLFVTNAGLYQAFSIVQQPVYAGLLFFGLLYTPIELVLGIVMEMISRKNEYEADRFAAETIDDPLSLIEGLKKLSATNLSNLTPHPFYVFINYSHPPLLQRIAAIEKVKREDKARFGT
jgi:STE24 endopeptidase